MGLQVPNLFKSKKAKTSGSSSTTPPDDSMNPPKYEAIEKQELQEPKPISRMIERHFREDESLVVVEEPIIEVEIDAESFMIPISVLETKAPKFLKENRKSESLVSYLELGQTKEITGHMPSIFAHWLDHGTLPGFDLVELKTPLGVAPSELESLNALFCIAERFDVFDLMDSIMDCVISTKYRWQTPVACAARYYEQTSGPCGLRLFAVRSLISQVYSETVKPSEFEKLLNLPEIMKDFFREKAEQGYQGAKPKSPQDFPVCSYHHARFVARE